jgi:hypothetical protein
MEKTQKEIQESNPLTQDYPPGNSDTEPEDRPPGTFVVASSSNSEERPPGLFFTNDELAFYFKENEHEKESQKEMDQHDVNDPKCRCPWHQEQKRSEWLKTPEGKAELEAVRKREQEYDQEKEDAMSAEMEEHNRELLAERAAAALDEADDWRA